MSLDSEILDQKEEASSSEKNSFKKYGTQNDYRTEDEYAFYVRSIVQKGMLVRCCKEFEEICKGDTGTVVQVDSGGVHDLNVQVDWRNHGANYWMRFINIEIINEGSPVHPTNILVGTKVRYAISKNLRASDKKPEEHVGVVTALNELGDVTVDFADYGVYTCKLTELEPIHHTNTTAAEDKKPSITMFRETLDTINDWSKCIRTLTVSSNELAAKYLLDKSPNYWQSNSTHNIGNGRHWIRLEIHENILIHLLSLNVSGEDGSHMPSLIVIRVGDSVETLKDYSWVSVKQTEAQIVLLSEMKEYFACIEIIIKQCHSNGIQCKVCVFS